MGKRFRAGAVVFCSIVLVIQFAGCADVTEGLMSLTRPDKYDIVFFFKKETSGQLQGDYLEKNLSTVVRDGEAQTSNPLIESIDIIEFRGHTGVAIHFRENAAQERTAEITAKLATSEIVYRVYTNAAVQELEEAWKWSDEKEGTIP